MLSIRAYGNTEFVNSIVKKPLYEKLKEKAKKLETTPDKRPIQLEKPTN